LKLLLYYKVMYLVVEWCALEVKRVRWVPSFGFLGVLNSNASEEFKDNDYEQVFYTTFNNKLQIKSKYVNRKKCKPKISCY
jgi:hypothetical protein